MFFFLYPATFCYQGIYLGCLCVRPSVCPSSCPSVFYQAENLSECQWIFTKLGICIDIVEIWFRIANGQISSVFDSYLPVSDFSFPDDNLNKYQRIFTKLGVCVDIVENWVGIAKGQISSSFDRVICLPRIHVFVSGQ